MKTGYTPLIAENYPPSNAKSIVVFDGDGKEVGEVSIAKMRPVNLGKPLYSFGLVSDMHVGTFGDAAIANQTKLDNALSFFEEFEFEEFEKKGCDFCCHSGDMTMFGFWFPFDEARQQSYFYPDDFDAYKKILDKHKNLPMHGCVGNHESYNNYAIVQTRTDSYANTSRVPKSKVAENWGDPTKSYNNLELLKAYTGRDLCYTMTQKNEVTKKDDVFIFFGQPGGSAPVERDKWIEQLGWLQNELESHRNQRCFVFEHLTLADDSGNPTIQDGDSDGIHNAFWGNLENTFKGLMAHYKNTIVFHGHSHLRPDQQDKVSYANYNVKHGFRSFSVPSTAACRYIDIDNNKLETDKPVNTSFCYIATAYPNHLVLRAYNLADKSEVAIAQYCIDMTIQPIEGGTFTDKTGIITT